MQGVGQFEQVGGALVWRRGTQGCAVAFGALTAAFGLLWGAGGLVGLLRAGSGLGAVFAALGAMTFVFGLLLATLRSEVRVDGQQAVIRRSALVTLSSVTVPVQGCRAVAAVRNLVPMPRAPHSVASTRYGTSVSVGLVTPQGFVPLATELEGAHSEASVRTAITALQSVTRLPAEDQRAAPQSLLAEMGAWRRRHVLPIVLGTVAFCVLLMLVVAAVVLRGDGAPSPSRDELAPTPLEMPRGRGRRRG